MKKVLHIVAVMDRGGQETFIMNVFRVIDREKVSFDFLCTLDTHGDYDDEILELGGKIHHFQSSGKSSLIRRFISLYKFLRDHKSEYEAFHIHTQHAMTGFLSAIPARVWGIPKIIVHSHNVDTFYHPRFHFLFRPLLRHMNVTKFACSESAGKWLFGRNTECQVVRNGIDVKQFLYNKGIRERVRNDNNWEEKYVIGHIGRMEEQKNHFFLLEVFSKLVEINDDAILVLVGDGTLVEDIQERARKLGIREKVFFLGVRNDVNELLQGFDLFLFPSLFEGLGIVLIEAQCAGLPCLISEHMPEEVDVSDLVERLNLQESAMNWAKKAQQLLMEKGDRHNYGEKIENAGFDIHKTAEYLQDYYCT